MASAYQTGNDSTPCIYAHLSHLPERKTAYQDSHFHPYQCRLIWTDQTSAEPDLSSVLTVSETDNRKAELPDRSTVISKNRGLFCAASVGHLVLKMWNEKTSPSLTVGFLARSGKPHTPVLLLACATCHRLEMFPSSGNEKST